MPNTPPNANIQASLHLLWEITPWDFFTGVPAGMLIFMSTILTVTILSQSGYSSEMISAAILAISSVLVGTLAGITRLKHGPATSLCAGFIAAGIIGYLSFNTQSADKLNPLFIGSAGILTPILFTPVGGFLGAKLRKAL